MVGRIIGIAKGNRSCQLLIKKEDQHFKALSKVEEIDFAEILRQANKLISQADQWITANKPWENEIVDKEIPPISLLYQALELIEPFLPDTVAKIRRQLQELQAEAVFPRLDKK